MADLREIIIWVNAVLIGLTFTALCARLGRRVFVMRTFGWNDALILLAAVSATTFSICQMIATTLGFGILTKDMNTGDVSILLKLLLASSVFYFLCNWAVKHALLLFYSEIVRDGKYEISIWLMHFIAFGFGLSSILVNIFQCRPFHKAWDPDVPGYCVNMGLFLRFNSAIMLATDFVLYAMPLVFTWHLQLRRAQRIGVNCLFGLGGLVLAVSAVRVYSVHNLASGGDFLWWFAHAMIFSVLENHLAIVVACAPSVKVMTLLLFPRLASSFEKIVSKVTPSSSRSRSGASWRNYGGASDLTSGRRNSDKLKWTPMSTPMPSPAYTGPSGRSRASVNFGRWFKGPGSPRGLPSRDSMEGGLVSVGQMRESRRDRHVPLVVMPRDKDDYGSLDTGVTSPVGEHDIRIEHTITVVERDASNRGSSENDALGRGL